MLSRRNFLSAAASSVTADSLMAQKDRPNILFLLTDDQRWDTLGCMGNPIIQTPHIDSLSERGVTFTNQFATTSICMTSRASIFTRFMAAVQRLAVPQTAAVEITPANRSVTMLACASVVAVIASALVWSGYRRWPPPSGSEPLTPIPLTSYPGFEQSLHFLLTVRTLLSHGSGRELRILTSTPRQWEPRNRSK